MFLMPALAKTIGCHRRLAAVTAALVVGLTAACRADPSPSHGRAGSDTTAPAASAAAPVASTSPAAAAPADTAPADLQRVVLAVRGMYCESCQSTVAAMLRRTPGVVRAEVSAKRGEAVIDFDATRASPAQLTEAVERLGYTATVKTAAVKRG